MSDFLFSNEWLGSGKLAVFRRFSRVRLGAAIAAVFVIPAIPGTVSADVIVSYTGGDFAATAVASGVTASDLGAGSSLTNFTATSSGNPGDAFDAVNWPTSPDPDPNSSFVFTLQSSSYDMTLFRKSTGSRTHPWAAG